jgi:hypothetical protein
VIPPLIAARVAEDPMKELYEFERVQRSDTIVTSSDIRLRWPFRQPYFKSTIPTAPAASSTE